MDDIRLTREFYVSDLKNLSYGEKGDKAPIKAAEAVANLVGSRLEGTEFHAPLIDFDIPVRLVKSSTSGHSHLYIDVPMTFDRYEGILEALVNAGVVEAGFLTAARHHKMAFLRKPGITKGELLTEAQQAVLDLEGDSA